LIGTYQSRQAKDSFAPTFTYKRPLEEGITRKKERKKEKGRGSE